MKEEFESAFSVYKISYWRSLQSNSKPFALSPDIQHDNNVQVSEFIVSNLCRSSQKSNLFHLTLQDLELYPSLPPF